MSNKLFNNPKPALYFIIALCIISVIFLAGRASAEDYTRAEVGPTFLSSEFSSGAAIQLSQVFDDKYLIGFGLVGQQTGKFNEGAIPIGNNIMAQAQLLLQGPEQWAWVEPIEIGLGLAYFQNKNRALGSNLTFSLSVGYERPQHWWSWVPDRITFRHYSNAGTAHPNSGQDLYLMLGWDFGY